MIRIIKESNTQLPSVDKLPLMLDRRGFLLIKVEVFTESFFSEKCLDQTRVDVEFIGAPKTGNTHPSSVVRVQDRDLSLFQFFVVKLPKFWKHKPLVYVQVIALCIGL